jgi:radical SAM superfamily enzyme YgiQ (UPF0313 family)
MHVCLVTAPTVTEFRSAQELSVDAIRSSASDPPLGILSLAAVLESHGDTPDIVDVNDAYMSFAKRSGEADSNTFAEIVASAIVENEADIYGFGSICSTYPLTVRIARTVKSMRPQAIILFGGPQASVVDIPTLTEFPFVDLVLRGETEHTLPLLLEELDGQGRLDQVAGLSYRDGSQPRRNANAPVIADLDALPSAAYHLGRYLENTTTAVVELGRGCPFACTFCSTNDFFRRNFRLRSPERVLRDMRDIAAKYSLRHFELVHDMFTVDKRRVAAFCEAMAASGEGFTWSCSARTDCVDEGLLELMAGSGCVGIFFGVEAGSRRMQKIIDKHLDPQRAEELIDVAEKLGIRTTVSLITGFPEETWGDVRETIRIFMHSARCPNSGPQLNLLAPLAGTPVYSAHKDDLVLEDLCSDMSHQGLSQDEADLELIRKYREIFPNFYLLPMPDLDREALLELREFITTAVDRVRWLISAIDQRASEIFDFFFEWREHRLLIRPGLQGSDLRRYYAGRDFHSDFLRFIRDKIADTHETIAALLKAEDALTLGASASNTVIGSLRKLQAEEPLQWADVPVSRGPMPVLELAFNIEQAINGIKSRTDAPLERATHYYATCEVSPGRSRLMGISHWMAHVLRACDGSRTMKHVMAQLSTDIAELDEAVRDYVFLRMLEGARTQGFITIYRKNSVETREPGSEVELLEKSA